MPESNKDILTQFKPIRALWPLLIGLSIVVYMVYRDWATEKVTIESALDRVIWTHQTFLWLGVAFLMMFLRDLAYMWQIRILTARHMGWWACFEVILLWEFFAAVSPSIVGGAALAIFMLVKERIAVGRSTTIVFTTILLDEIFYLMILPIALLIVGYDAIFAPLKQIHSNFISTSVVTAFWIAYSITLAYVLFLGSSLFVWPKGINKGFKIIFMNPYLKRWRRWGLRTANDLMATAVELRKKSTAFWLQAWAATTLAWMARYMILNCVLAAFAPEPMGLYEHALAFSRQAVLFVVMVVSPTPGSSGIAEAAFTWLFKDLTPLGLGLSLAILWRLISYYPYLIIGIPIMHRWLKRVYGREML